MVYGKMNKMIVEKLQGLGVNAVGLPGWTVGCWKGRARRLSGRCRGKRVLIRDDLSGKVERSTPACSPCSWMLATPSGVAPGSLIRERAINVDGDRAAAAIAEAMGQALVLLSTLPGLLRSFPDKAPYATWT